MEVKVAVLNAISQSCNWKSDFFEVKLNPYASLCLKNYLDDFFYEILSWLVAILADITWHIVF